jgi:hypothetical protein
MLDITLIARVAKVVAQSVVRRIKVTRKRFEPPHHQLLPI